MPTANFLLFEETLTEEYKILFKRAMYAYVASKNTAEELAKIMTFGLTNGKASKDGEGVKNTCKKLKIKHTYKAIKEFLTS
jgi:hypothetical protein